MIPSIHQIPIDKFLNPNSAKEFECTICARVMEHATDIGCGNGHLFCNECILQFFNHNHENHPSSSIKCPLCQKIVEKSKIRKDCFVDRLIAKLHVTCATNTSTNTTTTTNTNRNTPETESDSETNPETNPETDNIRIRPRRSKRIKNKRKPIYNRSRSRSYSRRNIESENVSENTSCEWNGEYGNLKYHLSSHCLYWNVHCSFCQSLIIRKNLSKHKQTCVERPTKACTNDGCLQMCSKSKISHHIAHECGYRIVRCGNRGCNAKYEQRMEDKHKSECSEEIVVCRYSGIGCSHRIKRRLLDVHYSEKVEYHGGLQRVFNRERSVGLPLNMGMSLINRFLFFSTFDEDEGDGNVVLGDGGREMQFNFSLEGGGEEDDNGNNDEFIRRFLFNL